MDTVREAYPMVLSHVILLEAVAILAERDADLASVVAAFGPPPLWERATGFPTLIHIILEQQVSLASANAAFNKLRGALGEVTPAAFLTLDDAQLKALGFSRQKTRYGRELANAVLAGTLDLDALPALSDDDVRLQMTAVKGIGQWTTDIYLLMALRRRDVFPKGDLALLIAAQRLFELPFRPAPLALEAMAEMWRPHRATAARILWHFYLSER